MSVHMLSFSAVVKHTESFPRIALNAKITSWVDHLVLELCYKLVVLHVCTYAVVLCGCQAY